MATKKDDKTSDNDFKKLLEKNSFKVPRVGETTKGAVVSISKSEVKLDINGMLIGVIRGPELYEEADEYANLKSGDEVEATVVEEENENGELELSFKHAGQEKAWASLREAFQHKGMLKIKITDANKGGLLARYHQIQGFLPVSQLAPENYPRISGGDKSRILEKLRTFIGQVFEVNIITLDENEDKIIFSEKNIWGEKQKDIIAKYKVGTIVEGIITAVTNFGVFISFGENMEGLIHISELAWQRIDNPATLYKTGDKIKAQIINLDGSKMFLSAKKLMKDPWVEAGKKYKVKQIVKGTILKVNFFGLFVKLDDDIHGLAHISQLGLAPGQKIDEVYQAGKVISLEIMSVEVKEHRLGLKPIKLSNAAGKQESNKSIKQEIKSKKDEEVAQKDKKISKQDKEKKEIDEKKEKETDKKIKKSSNAAGKPSNTAGKQESGKDKGDEKAKVKKEEKKTKILKKK